MKLIADNRYRLSTGREFYANQGIIGMSPRTIDSDGDEFMPASVPEGYDGGINVFDSEYPDRCWTASELQEFHDFVINMWHEWLSRRLAGLRREE